MWNAIRNIAQKYLDTETATRKFGQRLVIFSVAVAVHEGLSMVSSSIDDLTKAINNHGGDIVRASEGLGDSIQLATRHLGE